MIKQIPITRQIYKGSKYGISFFTYAPSASEMSGKYYLNSHPMLIIQKALPAGSTSELTKEQLSSYRFRITERNHFTTIEFFNEIVKWFYDPSKKDLFLLDNNNRLVFNGDYAKLSISTKKGYYENDIMKATPGVISGYDGNLTEGIHLYINRRENRVDLTLEEVEHIRGILSMFNFYTETLMAISTVMYTERINNGQIPQALPNYQTSRSGF